MAAITRDWPVKVSRTSAGDEELLTNVRRNKLRTSRWTSRAFTCLSAGPVPTAGSRVSGLSNFCQTSRYGASGLCQLTSAHRSVTCAHNSLTCAHESVTFVVTCAPTRLDERKLRNNRAVRSDALKFSESVREKQDG